MKLGFSRHRFPKNTEIPNFVKIRPVGAELFDATDRRTDRHDEVALKTGGVTPSAIFTRSGNQGLSYVLAAEKRSMRT